MATVADVQAAVDALVAQVTTNTDAEASAVVVLGQLGALVAANKNDPVALQNIADALQNRGTGPLKTSGDALAAAIVASTPAA